jgi:glycosyltransferase involved in cell wall biosynthesis
MGRILIVSADSIGPRRAGPGIRAWEFARLLAAEHEVTLASPLAEPGDGDGFKVIEARRSSIRATVEGSDVVVAQVTALQMFPELRSNRAALVIDLYDPYILENLEVNRGRPMAERLAIHDQELGMLRTELTSGDFFICASDRQRHLWLGMLAAVNRVNPLTVDSDPALERLLAVVPFGLPDETFHGERAGGSVPGIEPGDQVLLWGGGIWNWFDPLTLLRAVAELRSSHPQLKLLFLGTQHPNPAVPRMAMAERALSLARELGLEGSHAIFQPGWVPFEERKRYLAAATIGVSLHLEHLESLFSFRTRVLDYMWAGLPMLVTSGDSAGDLVERESLGVTAAPESVAEVVAGLRRLLDDRRFYTGCARAVEQTSHRFRWSIAARPLVEYCRTPWRSADADRRRSASAGGAAGRRNPIWWGWTLLRQNGFRATAGRIYRYTRRRIT